MRLVETMMFDDDRTRLILPGLAPVYRCAGAWAWPLLRVTCGLMLLPHGIPKFTNPAFAAAVTGLIGRLGLVPAAGWFWFIALLETVGGVMLALGLFTRPLAVMVAIEMLVISFGVLEPAGRPYEFTLMWALLALAIGARGGGRWSLDRVIGWEF
jgi:putative oxidoreductase